MRGKPAQYPLLKLLMCSRPGHGVTGMWNQPELHVARSGSGDELRMYWSDADLIGTMDQKIALADRPFDADGKPHRFTRPTKSSLLSESSCYNAQISLAIPYFGNTPL